MVRNLRKLLRLPPGPVVLDGYDPRATPGAPGGKERTKAALATDGPLLADLQERLYAEANTQEGPRSDRRLLLVLQGMDTSGKDGTVKHVIGAMDPQGSAITSFKAPTEEELAHDFLWRIRNRLPGAGLVGIFNRSHYEDVVIVRVHDLVSPQVWGGRYDQINAFEAELTAAGLTIVKVFLNISYEEQRRRLLARLDDPRKHWKFNPADLTERRHWSAYQLAYEAALERCNTDTAPWYVVPADRKWYRNWAVGRLLIETLTEMKPAFPQPDLDLPVLRAELTPPA